MKMRTFRVVAVDLPNPARLNLPTSLDLEQEHVNKHGSSLDLNEAKFTPRRRQPASGSQSMRCHDLDLVNLFSTRHKRTAENDWQCANLR